MEVSLHDNFIPITEAGTYIDLTFAQPVILQKVVKLKKKVRKHDSVTMSLSRKTSYVLFS